MMIPVDKIDIANDLLEAEEEVAEDMYNGIHVDIYYMKQLSPDLLFVNKSRKFDPKPIQ